MNFLRTGVLLAGMTALFLGVGYLIGGTSGMLIALLFAAGTNLFAYWNSDRMVLAMYGAEPVDAASAPDFHALVAHLAERAGLPMPKLYIMHNDQPNAFATGRDPQHAAVAATTGLLQRLSREEVAGVLAHELAHIRHRDTLTMTVTATLAGAVGMLANFAFFFGGNNRQNPIGVVGSILIMLLAPLAAMLVQFAISRSREYAADEHGAEIAGQPLWLASALGRLEQAAQAIPNETAERNPATAHLFIVNPLHAGGIGSLFSTHPSTADRIARLRAMAAGMTEGRAAPSRAGASPRRQRRPGPWG